MTVRQTVALTCNSAFGIENFRGGLIDRLIAHGYAVLVIAPYDKAVFDRLDRRGATCVAWQLSPRSTGLAAELAAIRRLVAIQRQHKPSLTFNYTAKAVIYGAIAARVTGRPCVSIITGLGYIFLNNGLVSYLARRLYRLTLSWSREIWFLNADDQVLFADSRLIAANAVSRCLPGEGVNTSTFAPVVREAESGSALIFLVVARLLRDKGIVEFVEAARQLRATGRTMRFAILGAIDAENPSAIPRSTLERWLTEGVVEHWGQLDDVRFALAKADVVVLPSYREGIPRALLEASAMGIPVIATDVSGCRDVVDDGITGYLCKPRDAQHLAQVIDTMAKMESSKRAEMGRAGRARVLTQFDEQRVVESYLQAVSSLIGEPLKDPDSPTPKISR
jgi:glycosyltransferase involved in cell wall biosynthesis